MSFDDKLAIHGGKPIRGPKNPLPQVFPREVPREALTLIEKVLESGFTLDLIKEFEDKFSKTYGVKHSIAVCNCTAAVHVAIAATGIKAGDEVIVTPYSDYGSIAGILWQGARPIFVDVDLRTGNMDPTLIEEKITKRTKAIVVVHFYGLLCDMDPIMEVAEKYDLLVIEDACQAPFALYKGRRAGTIGHLGCFSFDVEKHMPTDIGGMIITNDDELAERCRRFAITRGSIIKPDYGRVHVEMGLNYRYSNVLAAIGLAQLKTLPHKV